MKAKYPLPVTHDLSIFIKPRRLRFSACILYYRSNCRIAALNLTDALGFVNKKMVK